MSAPVTPAQALQWSNDELQRHYEHLNDVISVTMQALIEQAASILDEQRTALNVVLTNARTGIEVIRSEQNRRQDNALPHRPPAS